MINVLVKKIGFELSKKIRFSYYEKKRYVEKNDSFQSSNEETKYFIIDMLALTIFNQNRMEKL